MDERRRRWLSAALIWLFAASLVFGAAAQPEAARAATPVASDGSDSTRENTPLPLTLQASDDDGGDTLTFSIVGPPANGSLDDCSAGSCIYTPTTGYDGPDSFTWKANDGTDDSNEATFSIEVIPNNPPVASDNEDSTRTNTPFQLSLGASDDDGDDLSYTIVVGPGHGTLTGTAPDFTYTPDADYAGADSFTWKANDGFDDSNVATFSVDVVANTPPEASNDTGSTRVNTPLPISLFASDADDDPLTISIVDPPAHGSLDDCTDGSCDYTPDTDYAGPDSFTWKAHDGFDDSNTATFGITVAPNSPPEAFEGSASTLVDTAVQLELNASDPDGDTLTLSIVDPPGHGTLSACTENSCTYTPAAGYEGPDSFTWKANDGLADSNVAAFNITVVLNTPPQAVDDEAFTISGAVTISVLDNDVDPDTANGDTLTIVSSTNPPNGAADCTSQTVCEYTPDAGFNGTDTFQYTITDSAGETDSATVTVTVGCPDLSGAIDGGGIVTGQEWIVCSSPIANLATAFTPSHMSRDGATVGLLTSGNATQADDPDSNHPTIPDANGSNGTAHQGANDVSSLRLDLNIPAGANCLRFDFVFGSEEYPFYVGSFNDAFLAELDVTNWQVAGNDITAPGNFAFDTDGGSVSVNSAFFNPGRVVTTDGTAYNGTTAFLTAQTPVTPGSHQLFLTIFDANDHVLDSGVFVDRLVAVQAANPATDCKAGANQPPIAQDDTDDDILEDSVDNVIDVLGNDNDPDTGDVVAVISVTNPPHGSARVEGGQVFYTPDSNYNGPDSFDYTISDGRGGTATAHVTLRVLPINDTPIGTDGTATATPGTATTIDVGALVTDVETADTDLTYSITDQPDQGTLTGSGPTFSYTPTAGASGTDSFSYTVTDRGDPDDCSPVGVTCDGAETSLTKTVVITIGNEPPVVSAGADKSGAEGSPVSLADASAVDPDTDPLTIAWSASPGADVDAGASCAFTPSASVINASVTCTDDGTWTLTLSAQDAGHPAQTDTVTLALTNADPTVDISAPEADSSHARNATVNVSAAITDPGANDSHTCSIDWGDTTTTSGTVSAGVCTASHAYVADGPYTITVTVSDDDTGTGSDSVNITVTGAALTLTLEPLTGSNPLATEHTVTATLSRGGVPVADITVTFSTVDGPHAGTNGSDVTDAEGKATFSYTGTIAGTDTLRASAIVDAESTTSNDVTKTWLGEHTLTVGILGSGSVTSNPAGITCLPTCVASFTDGASVTLTPVAQPGFAFLGWSGDCTGSAACVVTLDADRSVTARFTAPGCIGYADFTSTAGLNLGGDAAAVDGVLRLTPAQNFTQGQAWLARKVDLSADLVSDFSIRFTEQGGSQGADGITFAIQNASATASGQVGGGIGYEGLVNSIVVELDTFDNGVSAGDADGNHVSVHTAGSGINGPRDDTLRGAAFLTPDLEDGAIHRVRVVYDSTATELRIYVDDLATPALTVDVNIAATLDLDAGAAWVGFTSATGGGFENHDVLDWSLCAGTGAEGLALSLAPISATNNIGTAHTVTATLTDDGSPLTGTSVAFEILDGPHAGTTGVATTNASGQADFAWTGTTAGTDTIRASATINERVIRSNTATKTWVVNPPPTVDAGADIDAGDLEGASVNLDATVGNEPASDTLTTTWAFAPGAGVDPGATCVFGDLNAVDTTVTCTDDGVYQLTLRADDGANPAVTDSLLLTLGNANPVVTITAPLEGATTGATVSVSASFTDAGANDTHTCQIDWSDGPAVSGTLSAGVCSGSHTYATSGPRVITVTVTDDDGGIGTDTVSITVAVGPPGLIIESYDTERTDGDYGLTESLLSTTRSYVLDPANFGPGGIVDKSYQIGPGISVASAATLSGVEVFFTGWVPSGSYTAEEKAALRDFVLGGGTLIATTDDTGHSMADIFGLTQGDGSGNPTVNTITEPAHPIASGPFGAVTTFNQYALTGHYPSLGTDAHEVGRNDQGTSLAVIERGALGAGSGAVILIADVDVFSNDGTGGAVANATLIKNIFAFVAVASPLPAISISDLSKAEGNSGTTDFVLTVSLSAAADGVVTVDYATAAGTATAPDDYATAGDTLTFEAGVTSRTITIAVVGDTMAEEDETFLVNLSNARGARLTDPQGVVTIQNDDNPPPTVDAGADIDAGDLEGASVNLDGTVGNEPASDTLTTTWSFTPGAGVDTGATCTFGDLNAVDTTVTCTDDGTYELTLRADDGANPAVTDSLLLTLGNANPVVTITAPLEGATTGATVSVSASFTDAGANDTHTCQIDWSDGPAVSGTLSAGVCSGSHTYATSGPRVITVTVTDDDGGIGTDTVSITVQTAAPDCVPDDPPNALAVRTAPGNLRLDGLPATGQPTFQSNTCLFAFAESKDVALDRNLNPIAPRATNMAVANPPTRLIPANTVVDSYLIHGDSLGASGTGGATLTASWTFDEPILGVFMGRDNLVITDALVGLSGTPGLTYERTLAQRGLELGSNDVVRVTGPNTIEVTFDFNAMDELRVLTGTIAPDCVPDDPPNALAVRTAPGNLRLDGLPATGQPTFQSNTCLFAFAESKDVALDRNLNPIAPRATNMAVANPPTRLIPANTVVDSYLIHGDSLGASGTGGATLTASWTFDEPILGVFMGRDNLVITDALVGLSGTPGLTYERTLAQRGLELGSNDVVRVTGPNTIEVTFDFNAMDELRVLTGTIAPDCVPDDPPNALAVRTAPGNLRLDGLPATGQPTFQSNTCLFAFAESKDVALDRNLNPIAPRATNMAVANPPTRLIPANTVVDSYLIHGDSLGASGTGGATLTASWTFDEPILGVFMGRDNLVITDALVGLSGTPGLTYERTLAQRGLELGSNDVVRVTGPNTIEVTFDFNAMDELRVLTGTIAPDCVPDDPPNALAVRTAPGNLRLDGLPATGQPTFQSNTCLFAFAESKDVALDRNLNPIAPRATNMAVANPPTRLIPANTVVDSYLIHGDSLGASGTGGATLTASWTFDEPILGVFMGRDNLVITDALVGLSGTPGLTYERTLAQRGLELGSNDVVRVTGPNTIEVTFDFNAMDELRVLTGTIAPDCVPDDPPNALAVRTAPGNLRLDGLPATGQPTFQSNTCLFAFAESKDVALDRNLNPIAPRATNMAVANPPTRLIPANTVVDSYLIHGDSLGASGTGGATLTASWTFDEPILGVFMGRDNLVITDALVGLSGTPGLTYERTLAQRGLELGSNDVVRVTGPNTIEVTFDFNAMDELRVLTGTIAPPTGSITIIKDAVPNDAQDFVFTGLGGFTLDDDADPARSDRHVASGLASGNYDVTETAVAGWSTGIQCNDTDGGTTVEGATVHVDLDPGQNITCTFTNAKDATVTIVKDAVPNGPQDFGFTGSFGPISLDDDTDPTLLDRRTFTVSGTGFGAKTVTEPAVAGWTLTVVCSEGTITGNTATLTVDPGDAIICTFTNTQDATVTFIKDAQPNHAQDFAFTGSFGPISLDDDTDPTLLDRRTFTVSGTGFGTKTVTETAVAGWSLTVLDCTGTVETTDLANRTTSFIVSAGDTIECTFTNTKDATVRYTKVTDPAADPRDFVFGVSGTGMVGDTLDTDPASAPPPTHVETLEAGEQAGTKTIAETVPPGWSLTQVTCTGTTATAIPNGVSFTVNAGDNIVCTFSNTKDATVTIVKDAVPNRPQDFPFTGSFGPFSLDDDTDPTLPNSRTFTVSGTGFGPKTVTETVVIRWEMTQISCVGDSEATVSLPTRTATLDVDPGETITCTYRNTFIDLVPFKEQRNPREAPSANPTAPIAVQLGDTVIYVLGVRNQGLAAAPATVVTDVVPARLRITSLGGCVAAPPTGPGTTITCDLGPIPAGQTRSATIVVQAVFGCEVVGTRGNDTINFAQGVTNGPNVICGGGGNDTIFGQGGDDTIYGNQPVPINTTPIVNVMWLDLDADGIQEAGETAQVTANPTPSMDGADTIEGGTGADRIDGQEGNDRLHGQDGDDEIHGSLGDDTITGGIGADSITGDGGNDTINGGDGADTISGNAGNDTIGGDAGIDTITGDEDDDAIDGGTGSDLINGGSGADSINGGDQGDNVFGGLGNDTIVGESLASTAPGPDTLRGEDGNDVINGAGGNDVINGGEGSDTLRGADGNDEIAGIGGPDDIRGGNDDDVITGGEASDDLFGDDGDDTINGGERGDTISGGDGIDRLLGDGAAPFQARDVIDGNAGNDTIFGNDGNDGITGGTGNDTISGGDGNDGITGGTGSDTISGNADVDTIDGDTGNDEIHGHDGADVIDGGEGSDLVDGGDGNDQLWGGLGSDIVLGGGDNDRMAGDVGRSYNSSRGSPDHMNGGPGRDLMYGQDGNDCSTLLGQSADERHPECDGPNRIPFDTSYEAQMEGGSGVDRLHGGSGIDRLDGGPEGGNDLVGGDTDNDFCSFGPNDNDRRAPSCELPSEGDDTNIPWRGWDWDLF